MEVINYNIIECDRLTSQEVQAEGVEADNKSSWTNIIKPIKLKAGDTINLQQCIISQKGADSQSIEFNGANINGLVDNFALFQVGFYFNFNGTDLLGLPFYQTDNLTNTTHIFTDTAYGLDGVNIPSPELGKPKYQHPLTSETYPTGGDNLGINLDKIGSFNPNQYITSTKYAKLSLDYRGWDRDPSTGRRPAEYPQCNLLLEDIPLSLKEGFLNPNSIADRLTLQLQRTLPAKNIDDPRTGGGYDNDILEDLVNPTPLLFNLNNSANTSRRRLYTFNGYTYKSIFCNFYHKEWGFNPINYAYDPIFNNLCVENPYKYVYGVRLIQDTEVYRQNSLETNPADRTVDPLFGVDANINANEMRLSYPVMFWSNYKYDGTNDEDPANWNIYSPKNTRFSGNGGVSGITLRTTRNFRETIFLDRIYIIDMALDGNNAIYLVAENERLFIRNDNNITQVLGSQGYPTYYINKDPLSHNLIIIWNAVPTLDRCNNWIDDLNNKEIDVINMNYIDNITDGVVNITNNELNWSWFLSFDNNLSNSGQILSGRQRANSTHIANFTLDQGNNIVITTLIPNYNRPNYGIFPIAQNWTLNLITPLKLNQFVSTQLPDKFIDWENTPITEHLQAVNDGAHLPQFSGETFNLVGLGGIDTSGNLGYGYAASNSGASGIYVANRNQLFNGNYYRGIIVVVGNLLSFPTTIAAPQTNYFRAVSFVAATPNELSGWDTVFEDPNGWANYVGINTNLSSIPADKKLGSIVGAGSATIIRNPNGASGVGNEVFGNHVSPPLGPITSAGRFYDFRRLTGKDFVYDIEITNQGGQPALAEGSFLLKFNNNDNNGTYTQTINQYIDPTDIKEEDLDKGKGTFKNFEDGLIVLTSKNGSVVNFINNVGTQFFNFSNFTIESGIDKGDIIPVGWNVISNRKTGTYTDGSEVIQDGYNIDEFKFITQNMILPPSYNGLSGVPDATYNLINGDALTTTLTGGRSVSQDSTRLIKNHLIITNIRFTMENIKIIQDFINYNKIYDGNKVEKKDILNDIDNYYFNIDLGRTDDGQLNTTNRDSVRPLVPAYMVDKGVMGLAGDDTGCISPHTQGLLTSRQELKIRASFFDKYYDSEEVYYDGVIQQPPDIQNQNTFGYASLVSENESFIKSRIDYCKENNIGIIPLNAGINVVDNVFNEDNYLVGFLVHQDYIDENILKIQNFSYFGFSPSFCDANQAVPMDRFGSAGFSISSALPTQGTNDVNNMANYKNIGATNPTITYNTNFTSYQLSDFHTPMYQNQFNASLEDEGKIVARLQDQTIFFRSLFQNNGLTNENPWGFSNLGINDSRSGIFINNIYTQEENTVKDIVSHTDTKAVEITPENFFDTLFFKLGFTYFDLIPIKFSENDFRNRFYDLYYNNIKVLEYRQLAVKPFTTNSDVGIAQAISANMFGYSSHAKDNSATSLVGKVAFGLGYNNNIEVALETQSAFMNATSIPVQISTPYYRIYTNLPIDNLEYQNNGNTLACIGLALRNYASSSFYYSYALSYSATVTKDTTITSIKTEIRNIDGIVSRNLGEKSSIIYQITKNRTIGQAGPTPEEKLLSEITNELKEGNKLDRQENLLERVSIEQGEEAEPPRDRETGEINLGDSAAEERAEQISDLMYNLKIKIIQNLAQNTAIARRRGNLGKPTNRDINDAIKGLSSGIADYFYKNRQKLQGIEGILIQEGKKGLDNPLVEDFINSINGFVINTEGELVKGSTQQYGESLNIDETGARIILDQIENSALNNRRAKSSLRSKLLPILGDLYQTSNNINYGIGDGADFIRSRYKITRDIMKENLLKDPLPTFLKKKLGVDTNKIRSIMVSKQLRNIGDVYRQAQKTKNPDDRYRLLMIMVNQLRAEGVKVPPKKYIESFGLKKKADSNIPDVKAMRKEGKKNLKAIKLEEQKRDNPETVKKEFKRRIKLDITPAQRKQKKAEAKKIDKQREQERAKFESSLL